ncbi:hypothetical protein DSO57_1038358 [Entomophthora muscae]|uniref:Uncharacterized protein n=1 Tax=Entomophthora muscae TaxID=34485 RepID=A0ACC2T9I1_9FUNG|nr:hypothetical protein DSO57_1038358 [Entomophthora muscae]
MDYSASGENPLVFRPIFDEAEFKLEDEIDQEELGFMGELPIDFLVKMFTTLPKSYIEEQFEASGYDFEATMTALILAHGNQLPEQVAPLATEPVEEKKVQVCRHFLEGQCFRKDCWFRHDLDGTICKFWLRGGCLNGTACRFLHQVDTNTIVDKMQELKVTEVKKPKVHLKSERAFPALASSAAEVRGFFDSGPEKAEGYDRVIKVQRIKDKMPWIPTDIIQHYLASSWYYEPTTLTLLAKRYPQPRNFKPNVMQAPAKAPIQAHNKAIPAHKKIETRAKQVPKSAENLPWIATGITVGQVYQRFREEAARLARTRNGYFERARTNYLNGKKDVAKKLSLEGQALNLKMKEQHRLAAKAITAARNPRDSAVLDLHCLHISEAIDLLDETIAALRANKRPGGCTRPFYLLIGSGHHSSGSLPRLLPAVLDFLDSSHLNYVDCSSDGRCDYRNSVSKLIQLYPTSFKHFYPRLRPI